LLEVALLVLDRLGRDVREILLGVDGAYPGRMT
jgi:hypothetical protein